MSRAWMGRVVAGVAVTCWFSLGVGADRQLAYEPTARIMVGPAGQSVTAEKRKLQFFDKTGKNIAGRELRGNELISFPVGGGEVIGILRYNDNAPATLTPVTFELSDLAGNQLYRIEQPKFSSVVVSPVGNAVVGLEGVEGLPESTLHFHDRQGREIASPSVEFYQGGRFSADGSTFVFATAREGVLAYTSDGKAAAAFGKGSVYDLSADGKLIVIWHGGSLRVYADGKRIAAYPTDESIRVVAVSTNGEYFGWAGPRRAAVYARGADSVICEIAPVTAEANFRSLALDNDGKYFAVGVDIDAGKNQLPEQRHLQGQALIYDYAGGLVLQKALDYEEWNAQIPAVKFLADGSLAVITRHETHFLQMPVQQIED